MRRSLLSKRWLFYLSPELIQRASAPDELETGPTQSAPRLREELPSRPQAHRPNKVTRALQLAILEKDKRLTECPRHFYLSRNRTSSASRSCKGNSISVAQAH